MAFGAQPVSAAFEVADADDGTTVWHGETKVIPNARRANFIITRNAISPGGKLGHFILRVGAAESARFTIADNVYAPLPDEFRLNSCARPLRL